MIYYLSNQSTLKSSNGLDFFDKNKYYRFSLSCEPFRFWQTLMIKTYRDYRFMLGGSNRHYVITMLERCLQCSVKCSRWRVALVCDSGTTNAMCLNYFAAIEHFLALQDLRYS